MEKEEEEEEMEKEEMEKEKEEEKEEEEVVGEKENVRGRVLALIQWTLIAGVSHKR